MNHAARIVALVRPYWKRAVLALALLTTLVVLDLSIPRLIQRIIDEGIARGDQRVVIETAVLMLAISAVSTVIAVGNNNLSVQVGESVARDLREAVFRRIMSFSYGNLDRMQTGLLMVRLTSDANAVQRLVQISLRIGTRAPLLMLGSLALMINTSPGLALTILPVLLFASILVVFFVARMEPLFRAVQQKLDQLNTVLQENIAGARVVKAFVRAAHEGRRFEAANEDFTGHSVRVMRFMSTMFPALTLCVNVGVILVIWVGGTQAIQGTLTIGQIVAFTNYLLTTMGPLTMLTMLSNVWASGFASAKRIHEVLDTVPEVQDQPDARDLTGEGPARVVFEDVVFDYGGQAGEPVLAAVDLVAEPGQTVAFLGATGAGKTTLVNLIPRFYDVSAGRVLVDGIDVRAIRQDALLAQVGIVPQESVLFAASVRENIRYGRPDASDEEVVAAAQAAQAHDFIMAMPQGYDTPVAQRGASLSGGQKQRIAIARALLLRPRILILDDATSSVDVETETRIQDALGAQAARHTSFVVAQRISTVLTADKIVVIDRGRVAAQGTHRELLRSSAIYREIYDSQLGNGNGLRPGETTGGDREARP